MLGFLFFTFIVSVGAAVVRLFSHKLYIFEKIALSVILGTIAVSWVLFTATFFTNFQFGLTIGSFFCLIFAGYIFFKQPKVLPATLTKKQTVSFLTYLTVWSLIIVPLFVSHMLYSKPTGWYTAGGSYGDLALHSAFIHRFAQLDTMNLTSPIYATESTTYPFMINFLAGIFMRAGASIQAALLFTSVSIVLSMLTLFFFLLFRISKRVVTPWIWSILFLCNGGFGFVYFYQDWQKSGLPLQVFLQEMPFSYTHIVDHNMHWSNIIADYFLPQRTFLIGLGIFSAFLLLWYLNWHEKKNAAHRYILSFIIALTPFFHIHTFLVMLPLHCLFILAQLYLKKSKVKEWLAPSIVLVVLALPQLTWQFGQTLSESFTKVKWGWMKKEDTSFALFWLKNMGLEFILIIPGLVYLLKTHKDLWLKLTIAPLAFIFLACNIFIFQPHEYDNMKFMLYSHLAFSIAIALIMTHFWKNIFAKISIVLLILLWSFAGILTIYRESTLSWQINSVENISVGAFIRNNTAPTAIFLSADGHNHPVTMVAGRATVMGYRGWLWTHGINYSQTERDVMTMLRGLDNTEELLKEYKVEYVFIGSQELHDYKANEAFFQEKYPVIYIDLDYRIYKVN